ncbi:hypothetical protein M8J76_009050 [Diaphorina citri]|nr:hypothetical protein M8J76_009050 [Diaphorina citri]
MDQSCAKLFKDLESNRTEAVDDAKNRFRTQFNSSKEPWLVNGLVDYFLASNSLRAVDVLVIIREPHDKFLFDRVAETLRSPSTRLGALTLLGHIVQRQPTWLYKIMSHPTLMKDLLKILKTESDMVEVISALLVLNILLPIIPGLIGSHLTDIFEVFSRLAAWNSDNPRQLASSHVLHLQVALYALFYQLYGMFPCTFLSYLKQEYNMRCDNVNACNVFNHTIKPMIETVRLHPFLIMSSTEEELCTERWKKSEHHAVVFNCTRFLLDGTSESSLRPLSLSNMNPPSLDVSKPVEAADLTASSPHASYLNDTEPPRFSLCSHLSGNTTPAPPLHPETTPTSIPSTPLYKLYTSSSPYPQQEGSSPPEAAIEATPETTPVKDVRPRGRSAVSSSHAVCALTDFTSPTEHSTRKLGDTSPLPVSPHKSKDFSYPSAPGPGELKKMSSLFRMIDERHMAQESQASSTGSKSSAPTSPLNVAPPTSTQDNFSLDDDTQHNSVRRRLNVAPPTSTQDKFSLDDDTQHNSVRRRLNLAPPTSTQDKFPLDDDTQHNSVRRRLNLAPPTSTQDKFSLDDDTQHNSVRRRLNLAPPTSTQDNFSLDDDTQHNSVRRRLNLAPPTSTQDNFSLDDDTQHNSSDPFHSSKAKRSEPGADGFPDDPCSGGEGEGGLSCSRGGIHMPNTSSMLWFKAQGRHRARYQTECTMPTSQSLGLPSPRDVYPPVESRVRRAISCPEMKKSGGGGSTTGSVGSAGPPLPEEEDEHSESNEVCNSEDVATQTSEDLPPPHPTYEHLFLGLFPSSFSYHHVHTSIQYTSVDEVNLSGHSVDACCLRVDANRQRGDVFNSSLDVGATRPMVANLSAESEVRFYREQVALMNLQLHFERHRRQVHLERNRRLLGKSRNNRASEEHNSALRDQVGLLQKEIERSSDEMRDLTLDRHTLVEQLETNVNQLKAENSALLRDIAKCKTRCETLEQETNAEQEKRSILNQILHETKAKLFDSNNEMEHYKAAILENKRLNNDLSYLQKEIIILGEMNSKYKDILSYLAQMKNEYAYSSLFNEAYLNQIEQLHRLYELQTHHLESTRNMNIKLEATLAAKDKTIAQFKQLFIAVKQKYQEDLEAMTSRYNSVQASLTRQRSEQMELYYQIDLNREKMAKLKAKLPGHDKGNTLATLGPPRTNPQLLVHNPIALHSLKNSTCTDDMN